MPELEVHAAYRFHGSDSRIAAFLAWLHDQLPEVEKDPLVQLAEHLGLTHVARTLETPELASKAIWAD